MSVFTDLLIIYNLNYFLRSWGQWNIIDTINRILYSFHAMLSSHQNMIVADYETLLQFNRKPIDNTMVSFLANITSSIIKVQQSNDSVKVPSLMSFIKRLIKSSNVQTPTLMATSVYLKKLSTIIPDNVFGIETTRHRIFLGCLILSAKNLNDSSPLNRHWAQYTNGLLDILEINTIERELLDYLDWDIKITTDDLITSLSPLLLSLKESNLRKIESEELLYFNAPTPGQLKSYINRPHSPLRSFSGQTSVTHSRSSSIPSLASISTISSLDSRDSRYSISNNIHQQSIQTFEDQNKRYANKKNTDSKMSWSEKTSSLRTLSRPVIINSASN